MGYDIVATYEDAGRSGLNIEGRPGLQRLLADVESGHADFETIVVYDVSRWGRFQNIDESASYEFRCQMAGVRIEFCAEQFANDGSIGSDVLKAIKRSMAAEHSRMLSLKVFVGQTRLVRMGFRQGAMPGLGLRRLLIDQFGHAKGILDRYEYKSLQTDRTMLVPGTPEEIATVRSIYDMFVRARKSETEIARYLNDRGMVTDLGRPWKRESVLTVLTSEKYIGNNVWNRRSTRLKSKAVSNPPTDWVRADNVFEPIIDRKLFDRVQTILKSRYLRMSDEELLAALRKVAKRCGGLSKSIINAAPECPPSCRYKTRFGSLHNSYRLIGHQLPKNSRFLDVNNRLEETRKQAIADLLVAIEKAGGQASFHPGNNLICVNDEFTVAIAIARCRVSQYAYPRWSSKAKRGTKADIFVLTRMSPGDLTIRDYMIAPSHEIAGITGDLRVNNGMKLDAFLFRSLDPLVALAKRATLESAAWD